MEELVSIIIPAYQEGERIERCLHSIFSSSWQNLEVIIVNDGSTDNTEEVIDRFRKKNERGNAGIRLFTISRKGAAYARNYGLRMAKGQFIGFADADDMIHPQMIEKLVDSLRKGNDLAACGLLLCNESGKPKGIQPRLKGQRKSCPGKALEMIMWEQIIMSICSCLFHRERIINETGELLISCPEDVAVYEDFAFVCEYISQCKGQMEVVPFRGYSYCRHRGSLTDRTYSAQEFFRALQPIFAVGERVDDESFIAHKLQYTFRFMAFWYEKAFLDSKKEFTPASETWKICMREIERYADVYMGASNVALHRKMAMWLLRTYPGAGLMMAKAAGKFFWGRHLRELSESCK